MNSLTQWNSPIENIYLEIEKAKSLHFINKQRANFLYEEINRILYDQVKYYNHGVSTSISKKGFRRILKTINYIFIHGFRSTTNKYQSLDTHGIQYFFDQGLSIVEQDIFSIKTLWEKTKHMKLPFHNDRYESIINEQIPNYLKTVQGYYAIYYYCFVEEDLDYPLIDGLPLYHNMYGLQGSDLVLCYTKRFFIENYFCAYFQTSLPDLIHQYEVLKGIDVQYIGMNIFEVLLNQLLANQVLQRDINIFLQKDEIAIIKQKLEHISIHDIVESMLFSLTQIFSKEIIDYIRTYQKVFIHNLKQFLEHNFELFVYETMLEDKKVILLNIAGNNYTFLTMLSDIQKLTNIQDKINYIRQTVVSVYDLIDLLESDIFYYDEYEQYFKQLSAEEIAIILHVMHKDLTVFHQQIHLDHTFFNSIDTTITWMYYFKKHLKSFDDINEVLEIEDALNTIRIKDIN